MKHRIRIRQRGATGAWSAPRLWYVACECGWQPNVQLHGWYGRETWRQAFHQGEAHLRVREFVTTPTWP